MTGKKGHTLIEMVTVIVIIGIVAAIGVYALTATAASWSFASLQDNAVWSAVVAMNRMSAEMRRLKDDVSVTAATSSQITFTDLTDTAITYSRSGNTLMRNSDALADNVTALTFTYYDDDGNPIAPPVVSPITNIRRIRADISVLAGSNTLSFRIQARPQNLRRLNEKFK